MVTFTEEILNGKLHFLCSEGYKNARLKTPFLIINLEPAESLVLFFKIKQYI